MPSYRPPISRDQYHWLEVYRFRLVQYTTSVEYREDLKSEQQDAITRELNYMNIALNVMEHLFSVKQGKERSVMAWKEKEPGDRVVMVHRFSCIKVAADALGCNRSNVSAVCKGKRFQTGGWHFAYEDEYEDDDYLMFDPNNTKFELK